MISLLEKVQLQQRLRKLEQSHSTDNSEVEREKKSLKLRLAELGGSKPLWGKVVAGTLGVGALGALGVGGVALAAELEANYKPYKYPITKPYDDYAVVRNIRKVEDKLLGTKPEGIVDKTSRAYKNYVKGREISKYTQDMVDARDRYR